MGGAAGYETSEINGVGTTSTRKNGDFCEMAAFKLKKLAVSLIMLHGPTLLHMHIMCGVHTRGLVHRYLCVSPCRRLFRLFWICELWHETQVCIVFSPVCSPQTT